MFEKGLFTITFFSEPPSFQTTPTDQTVLKGTSAILTCAATGEPKPTITWTYEGGQLPSNSQEDISKGTLTLISVTNDNKNEGEFTCTAINFVRRISSTARLTVEGESDI